MSRHKMQGPPLTYEQISEAMKRSGGSVLKTARLLRITVPRLEKAIKSLSLQAIGGDPDPGSPGLVYFLQDEVSGRIKIGTSQQLAKRIRDIHAVNPTALTLLGTIGGGRLVERELHTLLAAHRLHGEWFAPSPFVLNELARRLHETVAGGAKRRSG